MLTVVRWAVHKLLPYLQAYTHGPGGVLGFAMTLALLGAAFTESIGIHAIFGSFLVGIAIGDSPHLREHTRVIVNQFVSFIFAPVFFASIGLKVNFITHFDWQLTFWVLLIACVGKLAGAALGARWGRLPTRERWAIGLAMNARGAMEIILGLLALEAGLITEPLFVALVIMAIVTSVMSGPMMRWVLGQPHPRRLTMFLSSKHFKRNLAASNRREAIAELATLVGNTEELDSEIIKSIAWEREEAAPTGIGNGVAIPHASIPGLKTPLVAVGLSESGIDFDAPDGRPAHILFLLLSPDDDPEVQLDLAADVARSFINPRVAHQIRRADSFTEFVAVLKEFEHESL
jgi:mannitol/fructose-specific phosphotransferase system IIA component (Ntr-type)